MRNSDRPNRIVRQTLFAGCMLLALAAGDARAQQAAAAPATPPATTPGANQQPGAEPMSGNELAKEITNPVTSLWLLQLQFNNVKLETSDTAVSQAWVDNLYFQPIMPVKLTDKMNLITRPVFTLYNSVPYPTGPLSRGRTTDVGDTVLAQVFSPAGTEPWIFGIGPTWIFPTAGSDLVGQGKYQVGPAIGGGYITRKFLIAVFSQQWFSFAGDKTRKDTNQLQVAPAIYAFFGDGWSVGYSSTIQADFKARSGEQWLVPLGASLGKVVKLGMLPVQVQVGGQYFVERQTGGPKWNAQVQMTPVIPRLINKTLF